VNRIPFWIDAQNPIAEEQAAHPENYQTRVVLARHLAALRDSSWALGELLVAGELLPTDPGAAVLATQHAAAQGRRFLALREARRAYRLLPNDPVIIEQLVTAYLEFGEADSALAVASAGADSLRNSAPTLEVYGYVLAASGAPRWRQHLVNAAAHWLRGELGAATEGLDSVSHHVPSRPALESDCADVRRLLPVVDALNPDLAVRLEPLCPSEETP
jgi:predicted Zn-dependent protease